MGRQAERLSHHQREENESGGELGVEKEKDPGQSQLADASALQIFRSLAQIWPSFIASGAKEEAGMGLKPPFEPHHLDNEIQD